MLIDIIKYSSISTKIKGMFSKLLTEEDYKNLIEKKSVNEVAEYLKNRTSYSDLLSKVNVSMIHRGQLEKVLINQMINDYQKIFHHIRGKVKGFIKLIYDKYEIENLKVIFRILESGESINLKEDSFTFLKDNEGIRISKLMESKNSKQLITNLKGTVYYDVLKDYENSTTFLNLFNIETTLDQYYFFLLLKKEKKLLKAEDEIVVHETLTKQIDIMNLLWIYRSKKYFNMNREEIFNNMLQNKSKLPKEVIRNLVDCKDDKQFLVLAKKTRYSDIFLENNQDSFEENYNHYMYKLNIKYMRNHSYSIGAIISFIHLKELEIGNIISITEGIRYNIEKEDIKQFIAI